MSNFNLSKKIRPAKRAWKSFKSHLRSKFAAKIATFRQHFAAALRPISRFLHRRKFLAPPHSPRRHFHRSSNNPAVHVDELFSRPVRSLAAYHHQPRKPKEKMGEPRNIIGGSVDKSRPGSNASTDDHNNGGKIQIQHVDKVFVKSPVSDEKSSQAAWKGKAKAVDEKSKSSGPAFINKWKIPQFRGVDERAEEFIAKFRLDMKLERERSIVEFEEMLKRSA
ncbi:hypothetical protein ABFS82_07G047900 [Erythranthe guttata]